MKKFIVVFSIFLFLFLNITPVTTMATTSRPSFSEGFYTLKDLKLQENVNYTVKNTSPNFEIFMIIFDSQGRIRQSVRLEPNSPQHTLLPIRNDNKIVIIGQGNLVFS